MDEVAPDAGHMCSACQVIHQADGVEGGKAVRASRYAVGNERHIVAAFRRTEDRVADRVTAFAGSLGFVYIHAVWFAVWIVVNAGLFGAGLVFDDFPYGLLTMVVSLEAIFLSTFVMVSQNRQAARSDIRSDLDFENNLRSEIWAVHIGQALGIDSDHIETIVRSTIKGYQSDTPR